MITIAGSVHRAFTFPGDLPTALEYFGEMGRTLNYLPHIAILRKYADDQYRMLFSTTELGVYHVRLFCDIKTELDRKACAIRIRPLQDVPPVEPDAGLYSLTGQGYYASDSLFTEQDRQTEIVYQLTLRAELPEPFGLRFVPDGVLHRIAHNITDWRIHETADGFIDRSRRAFQLSTRPERK
jgi:hypothetical protein